MATRRAVPLDQDCFALTARMFKREVTTPVGDEHRGLDRDLREFNPRLSLLYSGRTRTFWVCSTLDSCGLPFPMFPVGDCPNHRDVLNHMRESDLQGRAKQAAKERLDAIAKQDAAEWRETCDLTMPNFGEYVSRLEGVDNYLTQKQMAREMGAEVRRMAARGRNVTQGGIILPRGSW